MDSLIDAQKPLPLWNRMVMKTCSIDTYESILLILIKCMTSLKIEREYMSTEHYSTGTTDLIWKYFGINYYNIKQCDSCIFSSPAIFESGYTHRSFI